MTLIILDGIVYSGRTTAAKMLVPEFYKHHFFLTKGQTGPYNFMETEKRWLGFHDLNMKLYRKAQAITNGDSGIIEISWPATIAHHNVLLGKRLEEDKYVREDIEAMKPDMIVFMKADADAISRRMMMRYPYKPRNVGYLMAVQEEFQRILDWSYDTMKTPYVVIHNSKDDHDNMARQLETLADLVKR